MSDNTTKNIRVPLNTHPSHLHTPGTRYGTIVDDNNSFYFSAIEDQPGTSPPTSLRSHLESFAGSYSRTSALYMAENLSVHNHFIEDDVESIHAPRTEEEHVKSNLIPIDYTLTQTISSHGNANFLSFPNLSRPVTVASVISQQFHTHDPHTTHSLTRSTFVQSVFNSVNVLIGIGVLALPLGFRCAGWLFGSLIFFFCTFATNYTAKVIAKCLDSYPNSTTYGDMGAAAFGDKGRAFVSTIFITELMTIG
jgi:vesicular inhibitory amino acid transporter